MVSNKNSLSISISENEERDETFEENSRPSWPFETEYDEHLHFDNLQRARDAGSA